MRDVDVGLCAPQGPKIPADIVELNALRYQGRNHEGGIDDFAITELFYQVILRTKHGRSCRGAVQQVINPIHRRPTKCQLDSIAGEEGFERLYRRIVTPGLIHKIHWDT